jgi:hypothetical protein
MWINRDVDLPQALITAQREGDLVVFAGAGVSMGGSANLPSFAMLAEQIAAGTLTQRPGEALDAFLGRVEQRGVDVQARARQIIDAPTSTPNPLHHGLVGVFRDDTVLRLVTTNFDRHFTTALRDRYPNVEIFSAPALPLGRDWTGLAYLHGAVEKPRARLVLTDKDFGQGYLADAWATRFLMAMFEKYVVLFVGYSHTDPVMKYLARSFVGGTSRFALTSPDQDDHWVHLGIVPIHFPMRAAPDRYGAIADAIESWTATARMGVFDHRLRIGQLVALPPPLEPESIDYLRAVVRDPVTLKFFVEHASGHEWLEWATSEGILEPLSRREPFTSQTGQLLARWFAERFTVQHVSHALRFVQNHLTTLNPYFAEAIAFHLTVRVDALPAETLRLWATALAAADNTLPDSLGRLLTYCAESGDIETAMMLFRALLRPRVRIDPIWAGFIDDDRDRPRLDVEVVLRGDPRDLREVWEQTLRAKIPTFSRQLLALVTDWIYEASSVLRAAGKATDAWDPISADRAAIEPHAQNRTSARWGLVIDIARDVLDWAVAGDQVLAQTTISSWSAADPLVLKRLAIHGTSRRTDMSPSEKLDLIQQQQWLYATELKHETFELLRAVFSQANEDAQQRFIDYSMTADVLPPGRVLDAGLKETVDYERYNVAVWLQRVAPNSSIAQRHVAELQNRHRNFGPREHPDMNRWVSAGWSGPRSPLSVQDLLAMPPADAATFVTDYEPQRSDIDGPDRSGLMTIFGRAAAQDASWALRVAATLVATAHWSGDVWNTLLQALRSSSLSDEEAREVLIFLDIHEPIGRAAALEAARFIESALDRKELNEDALARIERIGGALLGTSDGMPPSVHRNGVIDWLTSALNHPAGEVALAWIKAVSKRMQSTPDGWTGLTPDIKGRFEKLLAGAGHTMARSHA